MLLPPRFARALVACIALALPSPAQAGTRLPRPAHVVVVVEENRSFGQLIDNPSAQFIDGLFARGALFANAHGVTHPSLPNYLALFAGVTNDNRDGCPATGIAHDAANLASELLAAHRTFGAYSEALPQAGWTGCSTARYARKHAPWTEFDNVPAPIQRPFSDFPLRYESLPTVAFVIPDIVDDMHDGSIATGDAWLSQNIGPFVTWAQAHDALLILTWDEGVDFHNTIPLTFVGPMVRAGRYAESVNHYRVLRTLEDMYGLPHAGKSAGVAPISDCWK